MTSSRESEDSDSDSKEPTVVWIQSSQEEKGGVKTREGIVPTLGARMGTGGGNIPMIIEDEKVKSAVINSYGLEVKQDEVSHSLRTPPNLTLVVFGQTIGTSTKKEKKQDTTQTKSTPKTSEEKTISQATYEESTQKTSPTTTSFAEDFLANPSLLRARGRVSKTSVERFSSRYAELSKLKDLHCYSWKTLRDSYPQVSTMKQVNLFQEPMEESLKSFSSPWKTWGIGGNTKFLIAGISVSRNIVKGSSLSDILETEVPDRYFLSPKAIEFLRRRQVENEKAGRGFGAVFLQQSTQDTEPSETQENPTSSTTPTEDSEKT